MFLLEYERRELSDNDGTHSFRMMTEDGFYDDQLINIRDYRRDVLTDRHDDDSPPPPG